jgi:hypothetical protein
MDYTAVPGWIEWRPWLEAPPPVGLLGAAFIIGTILLPEKPNVTLDTSIIRGCGYLFYATQWPESRADKRSTTLTALRANKYAMLQNNFL